MAQVTKSFTENSGPNRATWALIANGTNATASGSTFSLTVPTIQAKYSYAAGNYKDYAGVHIQDAILEVGSDYSARASYAADGQMWRRDVTKTLARAYGTSYTYNTGSVFTSSNKNTRTVNVYLNSNSAQSKGLIDAFSCDSEGSGAYSEFYLGELYTYCGKWGPLATVTLNAPPTLSASNITSSTSGVYYANVTKASTTISNLSAKYGGTISEVKLTIGNQTATRTTNGVLSINLNSTGTFTPVVTVKDSRGQTNSYNLNQITVASAPSVTFSASPLHADMDDYFAERTTVDTSVSDIVTPTGVTVSEVRLTIGNQSDTRSDEGSLEITLDSAGTFTPIVSVKDSLNRTFTQELDPITVKTYTPPNVSFSAERTTDIGNPNDEGTSAVITARFSWISLLADLEEPQMLITIESSILRYNSTWYKTRAANGTLSDPINDWNELTESDMPVYCLITSMFPSSVLFDTQNSYTISITPEDTIESGTPLDRVLGSAYYTVDFLAGGHGIAFGKVAENEGFECDMPAFFNSDVSFRGKYFLIGSVQMYAGSTEPAGWKFCQGQAISRTDYEDLFDVIGTTFGSGDGSTTFNLPNFMDRFPAGAGQTYNLNSQGGTDLVTLNTDQIPSHTHEIKYENYQRDTGTYSAMGWIRQGQGAQFGTSEATGGGQAHENRPPFLGINFIIYTGV